MFLPNLKAVRSIFCLTSAALFTASLSSAATLFVGFNTVTPVQLYSTAGNYVQDLGPANAIAAIPTDSSYFFLEPNPDFSATTIAQYGPALNQAGSFSVNGVIEDGAGGLNGTLWLASYDGTIYQVSSLGVINTSWTTGYTHGGVAFDGKYVYTTEGDAGNHIDKWSTTGVLLGRIATPNTSLYGLGYDADTGDFWAGSTDFVYHFDASGALLSTLDLAGDARTPGGAVHDSIEVGSLLPVTTAVPEPASPYLLGAGLLFLCGVGALRRKLLRVGLCVLAIARSAGALFASVSVSLTPSVSNAEVGTTILWTASATDTANHSASLTYQFSVGPSVSQLQVRRGFSSEKTFPWTPADHEGTYTVQVAVKSSTGATGSETAFYTLTSRITGSAPEVSSTGHPLVALYSVPPCPAGRTARVRFKTSGDTVWQATSFKACTGSTSLNFYVAGMRASTTYTLQQDVYNGPFDTVGPLLTFTTGAVPASEGLVASSISHAASQPNASAYPVVVSVPLFNDPIATDTQGRLIWYLPGFLTKNDYLTRPVPGGAFLGIFDDNSGVTANHRLLREWDLAGNVIRETNTAALSTQLVSFGTDPVTSIHHEVFRFPNGDTGLLASVEKVADQGAGPIDVVGDMAIVLDSNLQVKWWWNEFEHLDIKRPAVRGEVCAQGNGGCPRLYQPGYSVANDWTHTNSFNPAPDGNLVISVRHQDWVIKLNYENGAVPAWRKGQTDNTILWRLGEGGSFTVNSTDPHPWFSHQHDATFAANGDLTLFDNGNTRFFYVGGNSRGQAWQLDEKNLVATLATNIDLGVYSLATGSAERLSNGNYHFYVAFIGGGTSSKNVEYTPAGALQFTQSLPANAGYRSFRMRSLYSEY